VEPSRVKARFKKLYEWNTTEGITWGVDTNIGTKIVGVTGNLFRTYTIRVERIRQQNGYFFSVD
jgi:hypothetical protein